MREESLFFRQDQHDVLEILLILSKNPKVYIEV